MAGAPKGNKNAAKGHLWRAALERAVARTVNGREKTVEKGLDKIADMVVKSACEGNREAWQEIGNRLDGRPAQAVTIGGDADNPLVTKALPFDFAE